MSIRQRENFVYGGTALGSLVFLLWIIPAYSPPYPGYGVSASLLPNVTMGIILGLSVLSLVRNLLSHLLEKSKSSGGSLSKAPSQEEKVHLWHLARFMVPSVLLLPAMQRVGFIPAGLLFMLLIQYLCGQRKPVPALLTAAGSVFTLYVAMRYGLGVPMP
ncbi:MAG: tripartite tricarboxylate transporter TctB family protein [Thermodesulfobacteriota bacterium]